MPIDNRAIDDYKHAIGHLEMTPGAETLNPIMFLGLEP